MNSEIKRPSRAYVARTLVSAASRLVSTLFSWLRRAKHRDESRCGSLKAAPRSELLKISPRSTCMGPVITLLCLTAAHAEDFRLHAYHATTLSMECNVCHVPLQKDSVTLRRPGHAQCVMCHAMVFRTANNPRICQQCHVSSGSAELLPYPRDKGQLLSEFSHARHV